MTKAAATAPSKRKRPSEAKGKRGAKAKCRPTRKGAKKGEEEKREVATPTTLPPTTVAMSDVVDWTCVQEATSLQSATATRRVHLRQMERYASVLESLLKAMELERETYESEGDHVSARRLRRDLELVKKRLEELNTKVDMTNFQRMTKGFTNAYAKQQELDQRRKRAEQKQKTYMPDAPLLRPSDQGIGHMLPSVRPSTLRSTDTCTEPDTGPQVGGPLEERSLPSPARPLAATTTESALHDLHDAARLEVDQGASMGLKAEDLMKMLVNGFGNAPVNLTHRSSEICSYCNVPVMRDTRVQMNICPKCRTWTSYADDTTAAMLYPDESENVPVKYFRGGHFSEQLTKVMGKEQFHVDQATKDKIGKGLVETGVRDPREITQVEVLVVARAKNLRSCYDHAVSLASMFSGIPPTQLQSYQMIIVRMCYRALQKPFDEMADSEQQNFFPTKFVMHKICQIFQWRELFPLFPLLRSKEKVRKMDDLWRKHMEKIGWPFVPVFIGLRPGAENSPHLL